MWCELISRRSLKFDNYSIVSLRWTLASWLFSYCPLSLKDMPKVKILSCVGWRRFRTKKSAYLCTQRTNRTTKKYPCGGSTCGRKSNKARTLWERKMAIELGLWGTQVFLATRGVFFVPYRRWIRASGSTLHRIPNGQGIWGILNKPYLFVVLKMWRTVSHTWTLLQYGVYRWGS